MSPLAQDSVKDLCVQPSAMNCLLSPVPLTPQTWQHFTYSLNPHQNPCAHQSTSQSGALLLSRPSLPLVGASYPGALNHTRPVAAEDVTGVWGRGERIHHLLVTCARLEDPLLQADSWFLVLSSLL